PPAPSGPAAPSAGRPPRPPPARRRRRPPPDPSPLLFVAGVGVDDVGHDPVSGDVGPRQPHDLPPRDAFQDVPDAEQARAGPARLDARGGDFVGPRPMGPGAGPGANIAEKAAEGGGEEGSALGKKSPGRNPSRSPASTAGRVSTIRLNCLACKACTASATAR